MITILTDGSFNPNSKMAAGGYIIKHKTKEVIGAEKLFPCKNSTTAEFFSILIAMEKAIELLSLNVIINNDSLVLINMINNDKLKKLDSVLVSQFNALLNAFNHIEFEWKSKKELKDVHHIAYKHMKKQPYLPLKGPQNKKTPKKTPKKKKKKKMYSNVSHVLHNVGKTTKGDEHYYY